MTNPQRFVESIANRETDFDWWYVDVVAKAELADDAPASHSDQPIFSTGHVRRIRSPCDAHEGRH